MPTFEYDRGYVEKGIELLESYLLADAAYWPMDIRPPAGEPPYPMLTLEGLLLSRQRLLAYRGDPINEDQAMKLSMAVDNIHNHWQVAWENKSARAYKTRLTMWENYLEEYWGAPESHADRYAYEVRLRVFLTLLSTISGMVETDKSGELTRLDGYLKMLLIAGQFIWGDDIQAGFPAQEYWYLYGSLPASFPGHLPGLDIT